MIKMLKKDELKSKIDACFHQVTTSVFSRVYGLDWFENEVAPYMRNIRSYSMDEKVTEEYEKFIAHNSSFFNADTAVCAKLLLFDDKYSSLIRSTEARRLLKYLLFLRNECIYAFKDIGSAIYNEGENTIATVERMFLYSTKGSEVKAVKPTGAEATEEAVKKYYDEVRHKAENPVSCFASILSLVSWVGVVLGCIAIFVYWEDPEMGWLYRKGYFKTMFCIFIAYISVAVSTEHSRLKVNKKYICSKSKVLIIVDNIYCIVKAFVKTALWTYFIAVIGVVLGILIESLIVDYLEFFFKLEVNEFLFFRIIRISLVCAITFLMHIIWGVKLLQMHHVTVLFKKTEKNPFLAFRCPKCKTKVLEPNGVRKIVIICPNCKKQFVRRRAWRNLFFNEFLLKTICR